jgi:hypothetical protein
MPRLLPYQRVVTLSNNMQLQYPETLAGFPKSRKNREKLSWPGSQHLSSRVSLFGFRRQAFPGSSLRAG